MIVCVLLPVTLNDVLLPEHISEFTGCAVIATGLITVNIAPVELAAGAQVPLTATLYRYVFIAAVAPVIVNVVVVAPAYTPPPQIHTTSPTHTHHQVSDTATMIAQMSALRASLIAKRDALLAQVAEINEALGD